MLAKTLAGHKERLSMYDRIRVTYDRNSDHGLLVMISKSLTTLANRKGWVSPGIVQRDEDRA